MLCVVCCQHFFKKKTYLHLAAWSTVFSLWGWTGNTDGFSTSAAHCDFGASLLSDLKEFIVGSIWKAFIFFCMLRYYLTIWNFSQNLCLKFKCMCVSCRWLGLPCNAPYAAFGFSKSQSQSRTSFLPAAHLLVSRRSSHTLLPPTQSTNGVTGEPQPWATQDSPQ